MLPTVVRFSYLRLIVVLVLVDALQHVRMHPIVLGLVDRLDTAHKRRVHRLVVAQPQLHHVAIVLLHDALALPQYAVAPGGRAALFTTVPIVGAGIVFVRGQELDGALVVVVKHTVQPHLLVQLVVLQQHWHVVELEQRSIRVARQPVVEVTDPEDVTNRMQEMSQCKS